MAPISLAPFLARALFFSFPFPLWYPQCYLRQPPHILLIILYLQYLNRFSPPPSSSFLFWGGYAFPPLTFSFLFILFVSDWAFQFWRRGLQIAGEKESRREKGGWRRERKARATAPRLTDAFQEGQSSLSNRWLQEKKWIGISIRLTARCHATQFHIPR